MVACKQNQPIFHCLVNEPSNSTCNEDLQDSTYFCKFYTANISDVASLMIFLRKFPSV